MFLGFFKEPARIACVFFEAFSGGFISLELKIISFLSIILKHFFRRAGFAYYFREFSRFVSICKIAGPHYYQEIHFDQYRLYPSLFQLSVASILCS